MDLAAIDLVLRATAIAILLLMAVLLLRDARGQLSGRLLAAFVISTAAYLVVSAPGTAALTDWLRWPLLLLAQASPVFFYLASRAMFDDAFRLTPRHSLLLVAMVGLGVFCFSAPEWGSSQGIAFGANLRRVATIILIGLAIFGALRDRSGDLLAGRQRFRFMFAVAVGAYSIGITGLELLFFDAGMPALPSALNAAAIALLAGGFFAALFSLSPDGALVPLPEAQPVAVSVTRDEAADHAVILQALDAAMARDRLYRDDTLTIGGLAARLGVPEYRLRKAINQQLGFRNFNAYVNALRLSEVKSALVDPAQREVPITTIALDAGFASIGPFNRAFKAATGTVPSEFRRRSLAES